MADPMSLACGADFGDFDGRVWLNAAAQGPLPKSAVAAAHRDGAWSAGRHPGPVVLGCPPGAGPADRAVAQEPAGLNATPGGVNGRLPVE